MKCGITKITLVFPHGISVKAADEIAYHAVKTVGAGVSEGGFEIVGTTPDGEGMIFSEDSLHYTYGHKREPKQVAP